MSEQSVELATFMLGNEVYGIEVTKVREILTYQVPTKLPNTAPFVKGVINIRGEVCPIIDLRIKLLGKESSALEYTDNTVIIASRLGDGRMAGIVVDALCGLEEVKSDMLLLNPDFCSINKEFLKGFFKKEERLVVMMDIEKILAKSEFE